MDPNVVIAGLDVNLIELFAVIAGFAGVWLTTRQNIWCWPVGLVNITLFLVLFFQARLYADAALQFIYIGLSIYGWYYWLHGGTRQDQAPVSRLKRNSGVILLIVCVVGTFISGYFLQRFTNADLPFWDSFTSVTSLIAQWLAAKKVLESWLVWIGVDIVYVGVYLYKDLLLTAFLFLSFLVLAVIGYRSWSNSLSLPAAATASE